MECYEMKRGDGRTQETSKIKAKVEKKKSEIRLKNN